MVLGETGSSMQFFKLRYFSYRFEIDVWYDTFRISGRNADDKMPSPKIPNTYFRTGALSTTATSDHALSSTAASEQVLSAPLPHQKTYSQLDSHIIIGG